MCIHLVKITKTLGLNIYTKNLRVKNLNTGFMQKNYTHPSGCYATLTTYLLNIIIIDYLLASYYFIIYSCSTFSNL